MTQKQLDEFWSKRLRKAITENNLHLLFQPIVSLNGEYNERYNIFMCMLDEKSKQIPSSEFMPSAERTGIDRMLDRWVIHHTLKLLASRSRDNKGTTVFISLTAGSLRDPGTLPWLAGQLKENRLPGDQLVFEIKTSIAVNNIRRCHEFQKGLKQIHSNLALDDFGIGTIPSKLLKQVPASYLKFDASFLEKLAESPENQETLKILTSQAHTENRLVIAQGVEEPQVLPILWGIGINYIQGDFLQEPTERMDYDFTSVN